MAHIRELVGSPSDTLQTPRQERIITRDIIDLLRQSFALDWRGIHGVSHWTRVRRNGLRLAAYNGARTDIVELFAFLHDSCRLTDGRDAEHGKRAAEFARALQGNFFQLDESGLDLLCQAIQGHTHGKDVKDITIQTCWDADRLDLTRLDIEF